MWTKKVMSALTILTTVVFSSVFANFSKELCNTEGYHCVRVKKNQSWHSLFPNENKRNIVMRVNRMNTQIWAGMTIAVPDNLEDTDILQFSPFPLQIDAPGENVVVVDPAFLAWGAYDGNGELVRWGPASAGADFCKDISEPCQTKEGSFRVVTLGSSDCYSTKFPLPKGGAPMPYCMYFNGGQALHGEPNGLPGYNASHGCVRLYVNDAEWLRYDFIDQGTRVVVRGYS